MKFTSKITLFVLLLALAAPAALAKKTRLVAVSADVVEISGTMSSAKGFEWNQIFDFQEADIPGILSLGEFERQTAVITRLRLSETEGRAQVLSNPKIVTSSGNSAKIQFGLFGNRPGDERPCDTAKQQFSPSASKQALRW